MSEHPAVRQLRLHERLESYLALPLHARRRSSQLEALTRVHRRRHVRTAAVVEAEVSGHALHAVLQVLQLYSVILEVVTPVNAGSREVVLRKFRRLG